MYRTWVQLFFLAALPFATGQECQHLLTALEPTVDLKNVTGEATNTFYRGDTLVMEMFQVVDITNEAAYIDLTTIALDQENNPVGGNWFVLKRVEGQDYMYSGDTEIPLIASLTPLLERALTHQGALPNDVELVSCDGFQSYAGLLAGEQMTVMAPLDVSGSPGLLNILFDEGLPQGMRFQTNGFEMLTLIDNYTVDDHNVPVFFTTKSYVVIEGEARLVSESSSSLLSYNEPIDESIFLP